MNEKKQSVIPQRFRMWLVASVWMLRGAVSIIGLSLTQSALAQECSPYSPDCTAGGGISPPSGACPSGQAPVGFCTVIICIEVCSPVATDPPPFTGGSGSGSGGAHGSGGSGGSTGSGGTGGGGSVTSPTPPYNFFSDSRQMTNDDIDVLHWRRTTGATPDGRPMETTTNAPLDGGKGAFMTPEGKERVVAERTNYLNAVDGGLWTCNPFDDLETMTTSVVCEQISAGYELPPGYTTVIGSDGLDGDYPNQSNKMTYQNWSEIHDGLTSGRLLDDPTNQSIILASMAASAPAIYFLGAAGTGVVAEFVAADAEVQGLIAGRQVLTAAAIPGATLTSLMQTTTNAIASANRLSTAQVEELTEFMEEIEGTLASQSRDFQVEALRRMAEMPYAALQNMLSAGSDQYARFINVAARVMQEAPLRALVETRVNMSDLQNEDLAATALRTLSQQAVGALPLDNPTLAATLIRGLPEQINESLGYLNDTLIQAEGVIPVSIRFEPGTVLRNTIGPDGIERMSVVVNALLEGVDATGAHKFLHFLYSFPVDVSQRMVN